MRREKAGFTPAFCWRTGARESFKERTAHFSDVEK